MIIKFCERYWYICSRKGVAKSFGNRSKYYDFFIFFLLQCNFNFKQASLIHIITSWLSGQCAYKYLLKCFRLAFGNISYPHHRKLTGNFWRPNINALSVTTLLVFKQTKTNGYMIFAITHEYFVKDSHAFVFAFQIIC
jgi:hypothetical protein